MEDWSEGCQSRQTIKYGHESRGTLNQESLCWRGPAKANRYKDMCNTRWDFDEKSHHLSFFIINFPFFCAVFLSGRTCYRRIRQGGRLTPSPTTNTHKYSIVDRLFYIVY
jgi:hypothetical protein